MQYNSKYRKMTKVTNRLSNIIISLLFSTAMSAQVNLYFASTDEAKEMIAEDDSYTDGWGQFDFDSRVGHSNATREELRKFQKEQCREFNQEEKDSIQASFARLMDFAKKKNLELPLPEEIVFVKTTMAEEGGAGGYTRKNRIYVHEKIGLNRQIDKFIAHELFHVLTRNSKAFKSKMYDVISFKLLDKSIEFSKDIVDMRISNPDISKYDAYADLTIAGKTRPCTMMIYANKSFEGGSFFNYLKIGLIPLDENFNPIINDGQTVIYPLDECTDFYEKVGKNTRYVINPEECLADNFSLVMTGVDSGKAESPSILDNIVTVLQTWNKEN